MLANQTVRKTFLYDSLQIFLRGIIDTGPKTFFLLIAVRHFQGADWMKSFLAAPTFIGMIFSLIAWKWLSQSGYSIPRLSSLIRIVVGLGFLSSALFDNAIFYTVTIVFTCVFIPVNISLQTALYRENYPVEARGKLFGWSMVLNLLGSMIFHWLIGMFLENDITHYRWVLFFYGVVALISSIFISRIPKPQNNPLTQKQSLRESFKLLKQDKLFGYMLLVWYIFGLGNLLVYPLRVIYLTEPVFGLNISSAMVAIIIGVVPDCFRVLFTPFWAMVFDKFNFIRVRIALNVLLFFSIFCFFATDSLWVISLGSVIFGIFFAGGNIAWNLWIAGYAPAGKTGQYMSLHVFFTGTRGVLGAFIGIYLASQFGIKPLLITSLSLVGLSVVMLIPLQKLGDSFKKKN